MNKFIKLQGVSKKFKLERLALAIHVQSECLLKIFDDNGQDVLVRVPQSGGPCANTRTPLLCYHLVLIPLVLHGASFFLWIGRTAQFF